jgi:hypothetical protein
VKEKDKRLKPEFFFFLESSLAVPTDYIGLPGKNSIMLATSRSRSRD